MARKERQVAVIGGLADAARAREERKRAAREREEKAEAAFQARVERYGKRLGRIAVEAGLGDLKISEADLLAAFRELAARFQEGKMRAVAADGGAASGAAGVASEARHGGA